MVNIFFNTRHELKKIRNKEYRNSIFIFKPVSYNKTGFNLINSYTQQSNLSPVKELHSLFHMDIALHALNLMMTS